MKKVNNKINMSSLGFDSYSIDPNLRLCIWLDLDVEKFIYCLN